MQFSCCLWTISIFTTLPGMSCTVFFRDDKEKRYKIMLANCVSFFLSGFMNLLASAIYAKEVMIEWQGKISFRPSINVRPSNWKYTILQTKRSSIVFSDRILSVPDSYFEGPYISPDNLTAVFQRTVKRGIRTIINGDVVFTLHACPDGFWW